MRDRNWKSVHQEISLLSLALSFTFLIAVWITLGLVKYYFYGIAGWGFEWNIKEPTFWLQVRAFVRLHVMPYAILMIAGVTSDFFFWPYLLRKENALTFHYDD